MKDKMIYGILAIGNKEFQFSYSDFKLVINLQNSVKSIFSDNKDEVVFNFDKKPLPFEKLIGKNPENGNTLIFFFSKLNYQLNSLFNSFGAYFNLTIYINRLIIYDRVSRGNNETNSKLELFFYSEQFYRFLSMIPYFYSSGDKTYTANFNYPSVGYKSTFYIENHSISINPGNIINHQGTNLKIIPCLRIVADNSEFSFVFKLFDTVISLLKFLFMRTDICPDNVEIYLQGMRGRILSSNAICEEYSEEDLNRPSRTDSIEWRYIYKNIGNLFNLLYENSLYLEHIPRKLEDRFFFDKTSMSKIAAAFESEFSACYSNETCFSEKKNQAIEKVRKEINDKILTSSGRVKDIYKTLLKSVNHLPLSAKIECALDSNEATLVKIKEYIGCNLRNEEIASICANYRNDIDHGNKIIDFKDGTGEAYVVLNCLIYSLQLKRAGCLEEEVNEMLPLFYHRN